MARWHATTLISAPAEATSETKGPATAGPFLFRRPVGQYAFRRIYTRILGRTVLHKGPNLRKPRKLGSRSLGTVEKSQCSSGKCLRIGLELQDFGHQCLIQDNVGQRGELHLVFEPAL